MSPLQASWNYPAKGGWVLTAALATAVGTWSLRYGLPDVPRPLLTNFVTHRAALCIHAVCAAIALLTGPWQFLPSLRARHIGIHRGLGRIYVAAVLVGWLASIPVGLHAETGGIASAGFLTLGVCWAASTGTALFRVLGGDIGSHRRWMVRSYALTAAAITLRIYLGSAVALKLPFVTAYPAIAWLCWIPNLAVAEVILRRGASRLGGRPAPRAPGRDNLPPPRQTAFGALQPDTQENEHA